jgi:hypothetical protein
MERAYRAAEKSEQKPVEQLAIELAELDPQPVSNFTPDNLDEVMKDFLANRRRNPDNATYSNLGSINFEEQKSKYFSILKEIQSHPEIPSKHHHLYEAYISRSLDVLELMRQAQIFRTATSKEERSQAEQEFKRLNRELYGETDSGVASAMAHEIALDTANTKDPVVVQIRKEFIDMLPEDFKGSGGENISLNPSPGARAVVQRTVESIYSPLLRHADSLIEDLSKEEDKPANKLKLQPQAMAVIFQTIIDNEFPGTGWKTIIDKANAIHVNAVTKTLKVPENRVPASPAKVRGLVVHEIGVHMLRSIIGEKADLIPLRYGLAGASDAEEGIAKVMESAVADDASRTGYQHYLTAHLLGKGLDFRTAYEIMWRYKVLDAHLDKPQTEINEEFIQRQERNTFKFMFRSIRGTNKLPWHTTLSYFKGTQKIWDYIDRHQNDPDLITMLFMGRIDPTNIDHVHGALDAKALAKA